MSRVPASMRPLARQKGLSLLELMIAIAIGLFLLVGLVSVFATSNRTYVDLGKASQQIENGRFATQILTDDAGHAGFYGRYSQTPPLPPGLPDPCANTPAGLTTNSLALPIQGYNNVALPSPIAACLPDANLVAGTDILVIRRADSTMSAGDAASIPNAALTANLIYMQSSADPTSTPKIDFGSGVQATDQGRFPLKNKDNTYSPIRRYHVHVYFIAPCSVATGANGVCTAADDSIPTLKRLELGANGVLLSVVPLVEGIEQFQVDYGIDNDKDGVPDGAYVQDPGTVANWSNVVAVRINVLSRQIEPAGNGYVDQKSYDMGIAGFVTPGGSFKRHVYNAVIRIVNPASRRES